MIGSRSDIVLDLERSDNDDLMRQQEEMAGALFAYCGVCFLPLARRTAILATNAGRLPMCRPCFQQYRRTNPAVPSKDPAVYLCAICRTPIKGRRIHVARVASKRGIRTSCGDINCVRSLKIESERDKGYKRRKVKPPRIIKARSAKPLDPCATCGQPASRTSSTRAQRRRRSGVDPNAVAYCADHPPGKGVKPGKRQRVVRKPRPACASCRSELSVPRGSITGLCGKCYQSSRKARS
jgi:hypothetical protein